MLQPRDGFVSVNGLRLHYLQWGDEHRQPLLLLHGGSAHAHWWDFFVTPFTAAYRVLALDLRGHGDSQWAEPPAYEIAAYAADVRGFIDTLELTNVVLAGHSLGGLVAVACAPDVQQRLAALVIMDVAARISQRAARYIATLRLLPQPVYHSPDEAVRRFRLLPPANGVRREVLAHLVRCGIRRRDDGMWTLKFDRRTLEHIEPCDLTPILRTLRLPMLIARGRESAAFSARAFAQLATALPHARTVEISGAHHHIMLDAPEALAEALGSFLANGGRGESRSGS